MPRTAEVLFAARLTLGGGGGAFEAGLLRSRPITLEKSALEIPAVLLKKNRICAARLIHFNRRNGRLCPLLQPEVLLMWAVQASKPSSTQF